MSYVRDALGNSDDMVQAMDLDENEVASQIQFILRPTKKAPTKVSLGMLHITNLLSLWNKKCSW